MDMALIQHSNLCLGFITAHYLTSSCYKNMLLASYIEFSRLWHVVKRGSTVKVEILESRILYLKV